MTATPTEACKGPRGARALPPVPAPWMSTWKPNQPLQMSTWELECEQEQLELEAPLTKRQLKHRRNRDSKLAKKFVSLNAEISNLKSRMDTLEDKITKASKRTNARFKRKKIRSMKREVDKIAERLRESEKALGAVEPRVPKDRSVEPLLNYIFRIGTNT